MPGMSGLELLLQLEAAHSRHAHVECQTTRLLRVIASQELLSGGEHSRSQANRFDEQPQRVSHCGVIIHDEYGRRWCCHALPPRVEGSRKTKQAPQGTFGR